MIDLDISKGLMLAAATGAAGWLMTLQHDVATNTAMAVKNEEAIQREREVDQQRHEELLQRFDRLESKLE